MFKSSPFYPHLVHSIIFNQSINLCKLDTWFLNIYCFVFNCIGINVKSDRQKIRDLKLAMFIANHSAIRSVDHLGELLKHIGDSQFSDLELHRTKCSKLIMNVIAPVFLNELIEDIGTSSYSIILDESTDIGTNKYMAFCVRYYSCSQLDIITDFLGFVEIEKATSEILKTVFLEFLEKSKLNIQNLIGIGTDGASNLCGKNKSLFTLLKEIIPHLQLIKCVCHSLNICASNACDELPSSLEFLVREIRSWFSHSSLRQLRYRDLFQTLYEGKQPPRIVQLSTTRWLAWYGCIKSVLDQWLPLKMHFNLISKSKEGCYTSRTLSDMINDDTHLLYLLFLKPVLYEVTQVNIVFQGTNVDIYKAYNDLKILLISLLKRILKPYYMKKIFDDISNKNIINVIDIEVLQNSLRLPETHLPCNSVDFGHQFKEQSKISLQKQSIDQLKLNLIMERAARFLLRLCHEIVERLPQNLKVIEKLKYLSPSFCFDFGLQPRVTFKDFFPDLAGI